MWTGKRGELEIYADILSALADDKLKKTHVSHKANLDSRATDRYLQSLIKMKMVTRHGDDTSYFVIEQRGRHFLEVYEELLGFCGIESAMKPSLET